MLVQVGHGIFVLQQSARYLTDIDYCLTCSLGTMSLHNDAVNSFLLHNNVEIRDATMTVLLKFGQHERSALFLRHFRPQDGW